MLDDGLRELVHLAAREHAPDFPARLVEALVLVESGGDPDAVSPVGAVGLMQVMPFTAARYGVTANLLPHPSTNLTVGCRHLSEQYRRFPEIPDWRQRVSFALAAYNGGRGWINAALAEARAACGEPRRLSAGPAPGVWQRWEVAGAFLHRVRSRAGKRPDAAQILQYVARVWATHDRLIGGERGLK